MRLTSEEIQKSKARLSKWHSPADMLTAAEQCMDHLGCEDLFNQSGLEFVRETWVAGTFADKHRAASVRLVSSDRPDFELRFQNDGIEAVELVEADICRRKRGDEYRALAAAENPTYLHPVEEWATAEQAHEAIEAMATKKAKRARELAAEGSPYPPGTALLIYLNIQDFGAHHTEIEAVFDRAVQPARGLFSSIWILWKARAYHIC